MSLKDIVLNKEYRSFHGNIVKDFYIPILRQSNLYKRAVGFFSSTALVELSTGISSLAENGGTIQIIASPYLSNEDIEAIKKGYYLRDKIVKEAVLRTLIEANNYFEKERLNLLACLIADNILDIKVAITEEMGDFGMYHEKMGIFSDNSGNKIAFSGSMNESVNAFQINYESIDVYCNWRSLEENERVESKEIAFTRIWNNKEEKVTIINFPELSDEIINRYKKSPPNYNIDFEEEQQNHTEVIRNVHGNYPLIPDVIKLHDYQNSAIEKWAENGYRGIFDMATGTGKTITGLGAITKLSQYLLNKLAVIIACPYQHLVEQWVEDIEKFNINPIIGYSASIQSDWRKRLDNSIREQKLGVKGKEFFCFICTNATFSSSFVQSYIHKIKGNILFVVDEAHNFGAANLSKLLLNRYDYRLGLSATIDRFRDEYGTSCLYNFFGKKCIEYTLEKAIRDKRLTEYKYFPILCTLTNNELEKYIELTNEIRTCITKDKTGKPTLNERGKRLALERARLVAGASDKIAKLKECILSYKDNSHILVYCGAANIYDSAKDFSDVDDFDKRQIDVVTDLLGNQLLMKVSQFTSREDIKEREILKKKFSEGNELQVLIAIKCLDEGVNIPAINTAFILASTSNPKEYIQRRGRVLRLFPGKDYSVIFDFITLPYSLDNVTGLIENQISKVVGLVKNELQRATDFSGISLNKYEAENIIDMIKSTYYINDFKINLEDDFYYD
jgi:superfamily II DNA or RNA helicase